MMWNSISMFGAKGCGNDRQGACHLTETSSAVIDQILSLSKIVRVWYHSKRLEELIAMVSFTPDHAPSIIR